VTSTASERGTLSWQQLGRLRRDEERKDRSKNINIGTLFAIGGHTTADQIRDRLTALVQRECALRITDASLDDGGYVGYSSSLDLPLRVMSAGSPAELKAIAARMSHRAFPRQGGPMWEVAVIEHPDDFGRPRRSLCAVFDHLVSDGCSLQLFRDEIMAGNHRPAGGQNGSYLDWVDWQREQFPVDAPEIPTAARDFWRRYLDGTTLFRAPALPFSVKEMRPSGSVHVIRRDLPASAATLRSAAGTLRTTPFLLILGSVACAISEAGGENDVTFAVSVSGRRSGFLDTQGWFAGPVPVRVRDKSLGSLRHAVQAATRAWVTTLEFQDTPWDYISLVCGDPEATVRYRQAQVDINFLLFDIEEIASHGYEDQTIPGNLSTLRLGVVAQDGGTYHLDCQFDPERFVVTEVHAFLRRVADNLIQLTG